MTKRPRPRGYARLSHLAQDLPRAAREAAQDQGLFTGGTVCVICNLPFVEYGNSAEPVKHGRCCNVCNDLHVIPARIGRQRRVERDQQQEE